jgi:hypothetical protein
MATTIPATGTKFSDVRNAFNTEGYGISTSFKDYRLGGPIVPFTPPFYSIGAATPGDDLKLSQFSGFTVPSQLAVSLGNHSISAVADETSSVSCTVYFILNSDGTAKFDFGSTTGAAFATIDGTPDLGTGLYNLETWLDGGLNSDVAVIVTNSGSALLAGSAALGSYLNLGTTRQWGLQAVQSSIGSQTKACTLSITLVQATNTSNVLDTATVTIQVQANITT